MLKIYSFCHGEAEWALSGQHSGRADSSLTLNGEEESRRLGERIRVIPFSHVLSSPLRRSRETCSLAGLLSQATIDDDLSEWNMGNYEGKTGAEIAAQCPDWNIFRNGCPNGEMPNTVSSRADRLISKLVALDGNIALFSHRYFGRVLAARWIGLAVNHAQNFFLDTASVSVLSCENDRIDQPVIALWNSVGVDVFTESVNHDVCGTSAMKGRAIERWEGEGGELKLDDQHETKHF